MRNNFSRYLTNLFADFEQSDNQIALKSAKSAFASAPAFDKDLIPQEFNGKDFLSYLLSVDAELEHGLMVQYLYAGYSLGGSHIPENYHEKVRCWQEIILGIAKEEMGHLITIQNVLRLIGAPLHFDRDDYLWDFVLYPFSFKLEPLTIKSLAKYVYAESPEGWINSDDPIAKEIKAIIQLEGHGDPVGTLFKVMLQLIDDPDVISDTVFQAPTYPYQAKFDEWGRGYAGGNRGNTTSGHPAGAPDVLVVPLTSRDDARNALKQVAEQGEAQLEENSGGLPSHFDRFLLIYKELSEVLKEMPEGWQASRNLAINPYTDSKHSDDANGDLIENEEAVLWANLLNARYRLLLAFIRHSFLLDDGFNQTTVSSLRGTIVNASFGEMYNLRSITNVLIKTPIKKGSDKMAGPPFAIPYSLDLPLGEHNRWRQHQDIIIGSQKLVKNLLTITSSENHNYLKSLQESDETLLAVIRKLTDPV